MKWTRKQGRGKFEGMGGRGGFGRGGESRI